MNDFFYDCHSDLNYNALESFPEKVFTQDGVKHKIVRM